MSGSKIPLKILVDTEKKKVLYAEADHNFVDTLFSFLTLPLGTIVRLLQDEKLDSIGSLSSLYEGLGKLDPKHFWTGQYCKNMLLRPINSSDYECQDLKVNVDGAEPAKYYICEDWNCSHCRKTSCYYSRHENSVCNCGKPLNREILHESKHKTDDNFGVFVVKTPFVIYDDLRVMPSFLCSSFQLLNNAGVEDVKVVEEKILTFGFKEFVYLLKLALSSETPLTDFIFRKKSCNLKMEKVKSSLLCTATNSGNVSKKITLKLVVLKSNKKVLFGQAEEDFVDFIFGFLTIPLGKVASLLDNSTSLGCVDNLYRSVSDLTSGRHIKPNADKLIQPQFAHVHLSKNLIFCSRLYYMRVSTSGLHCWVDFGTPTDAKALIMFDSGYSTCPMIMRDTMRDGGFVKGPGLFMVTDDLVVTYSTSIASLNIFRDMRLPVCDVEELVVSIGVDEALCILKASLHSKFALTDGLSYILKRPKEDP